MFLRRKYITIDKASKLKIQPKAQFSQFNTPYANIILALPTSTITSFF